ncbi:MAG: Rrf2 family transcriptional regulator [Clostridium paraputrificum]
MCVDATTDYAIRIVKYLAEKNGVATTKEISEATNTPLKYIPKIIRSLREKGSRRYNCI